MCLDFFGDVESTGASLCAIGNFCFEFAVTDTASGYPPANQVDARYELPVEYTVRISNKTDQTFDRLRMAIAHPDATTPIDGIIRYSPREPEGLIIRNTDAFLSPDGFSIPDVAPGETITYVFYSVINTQSSIGDHDVLTPEFTFITPTSETPAHVSLNLTDK
jgi:hypothetical protein